MTVQLIFIDSHVSVSIHHLINILLSREKYSWFKILILVMCRYQWRELSYSKQFENLNYTPGVNIKFVYKCSHRYVNDLKCNMTPTTCASKHFCFWPKRLPATSIEHKFQVYLVFLKRSALHYTTQIWQVPNATLTYARYSTFF